MIVRLEVSVGDNSRLTVRVMIIASNLAVAVGVLSRSWEGRCRVLLHRSVVTVKDFAASVQPGLVLRLNGIVKDTITVRVMTLRSFNTLQITIVLLY